MSPQAAMEMRRRMVSLPWEMLGDDPALITLTYPKYGAQLVPNGRVLERHRSNFAKRYQRDWGRMVGTWVKEFHQSGLPHIHFFIGLPCGLNPMTLALLRQRTMEGKRLERQYGPFVGRGKLEATYGYVAKRGGMAAGAFVTSLCKDWSEVIGTTVGGRTLDSRAWGRGVDVRMMHFGDGLSRRVASLRLAEYLAGEAGKLAQKQTPEGFEGLGKRWGVLGEDLGFTAGVEWQEISLPVARQLERRLRRWIAWKVHNQGRKAPRYRPGSGATALGMPPEKLIRMLRYSTEAAERQSRKRQEPRASVSERGDFIFRA